MDSMYRKAIKLFEKEHLFVKSRGIDIKVKKTQSTFLDVEYVDYSHFCNKDTQLSLYTFKKTNSKNNAFCETAMICNTLFEGNAVTNDFTIYNLKKNIEFTDTELFYIKSYQCIFFNFMSNSNNINGFMMDNVLINKAHLYYAVPIVVKSNGVESNEVEIDFEYIKSILNNFISIPMFCVENNIEMDCSKYLLWDLKNKQFVLYVKECEIDLGDKMELHKDNEHACKMMKLLRGQEYFYEYFEMQNGVELVRKKGKGMFYGISLNTLANKLQFQIKEINTKMYCTELFVVTPISSNIVREQQQFKENYLKMKEVYAMCNFMSKYFYTEDLALLTQAFTPIGLVGENLVLKDESFTENNNLSNRDDACLYSYERLEFLGDCVLKFLTTCNIVFTRIDENIVSHKEDIYRDIVNYVVKIKDTYIGNDHLSKICYETGIYKYIRNINKKFDVCSVDGTFQDKGIERIFESYTNYFNMQGTFERICGEKKEKMELNKMHADIIEALIGVIYLQRRDLKLKGEKDFESKDFDSKDFRLKGNLLEEMHRGGAKDTKLDVLPCDTIKQTLINVTTFLQKINLFKCSINTDLFSNKELKYKYYGFLDRAQEYFIEDKFNYVFKNRGLLEKVLVHSGIAENCFNAQQFNVLEIIGDALLDLMVVEEMYLNFEECKTPLHLHSYKKSYVNNISLGNIIKGLGVDKIAKRNCKFSTKAYGDMFEALVGAIFADMQFDINVFMKYYRKNMRKYIVEYRSEVNYD